MMIRSLKVKGDMEGAKASLTKALAIFADDPATGSQLADMGRSLGIAGDANNSSALPSAPALNQETVASVQALPAEDQQAMIKAMVQRLADKLVQSPHDADGWIRLIRARMVLNETDLAREALKRAVAEFSSDAAASNQIVTAARQLGVSID
jgi:cytochrome c-type biogenesis protein CcmH